MHLWQTSARVSPIIAPKLPVLLSRDERDKAMRFRRDADRDRYVASHAMVRLVLSRYAGAPPASLEFGVGEHGKPELEQDPGFPLSFNLSHSGDLALLAISGEPAVGVDVEEIRNNVDVPALAATVLSDAELRVLHGAPIEAQHSLFFRCWVRKEAVLKACGLGLALEPRQVAVLRDESGSDPCTVTVLPAINQANWGVRDVEISDRYAAAVAAPGLDWSLRCFEHRWSAITPPSDLQVLERRS